MAEPLFIHLALFSPREISDFAAKLLVESYLPGDVTEATAESPGASALG